MHGHRGGDQLLVAVGERLGRLLRPHDTVSRLGGEEFAVLCEDVTTVRQAHVIAARLATGLAAPFRLTDLTMTITASIGLATGEPRGQSAEAILHAADIARYGAGRGRGTSPGPTVDAGGWDPRVGVTKTRSSEPARPSNEQ